MKDGLDIRESLRHWHQRQTRRSFETLELYVQIPSRGKCRCSDLSLRYPLPTQKNTTGVDLVRRNTRRSSHSVLGATLNGEHGGTRHRPITPYGGALFIFPPRPIPGHLDRRGARIRQDTRRAVGRSRSRPLTGNPSGISDPCSPKARWRQIAKHSAGWCRSRSVASPG